MNSKMTNSQLSTEPKKKKKTTRTGREFQKWRSHRGLAVGRGRGENGGKYTGNKKDKW